MIAIDDFTVNKSDDLILSGGDFQFESIKIRSSLKNAKRRLSARLDDFIFIQSISAGIESFIHSYISDITLSEIEQNIRLALTTNNLFENKEVVVYFDDTQNSKLGIIVSFKIPGLVYNPEDENLTFSVYVDMQNQRAYS